MRDNPGPAAPDRSPRDVGMFGRRLPLPGTFGCDERMMGYAVERVEQSGESDHGEGAPEPGATHTEMLNNIGIIRQFHR